MIWIIVSNFWSSVSMREAGTWPKINSVLETMILSQVTIQQRHALRELYVVTIQQRHALRELYVKNVSNCSLWLSVKKAKQCTRKK